MKQFNKRQRIQKGQSKIDNPEKLVTPDEDKQTKAQNTICVGHHYTQTNTTNLYKT